MNYQNENSLTPSQVHFLRSILDGKREITEAEAATRSKLLGIQDLVFPCAVICISPYYSGILYSKKDELIEKCSDYICRFFQKTIYIPEEM